MSSSPLHAATGTTPAPDAPIQIRARGRSFLALVLSPERPLSNWLESLDAQIARSAAFFAGKPVILDLALLHADDEGLDTLQARLIERGIRIIGVEGGNPEWPALAQWDMPTGLEGGRASGAVDIPETTEAISPVDTPKSVSNGETRIVDASIRSGQSIMHMTGDLVVIGSVASGAEVVASGSIHVYGSLRGRAVAGVGGQTGARIFATRTHAELLAVDGYYMTAEEMEAGLVGLATQALLVDDRIVVQKIG